MILAHPERSRKKTAYSSDDNNPSRPASASLMAFTQASDGSDVTRFRVGNAVVTISGTLDGTLTGVDDGNSSPMTVGADVKCGALLGEALVIADGAVVMMLRIGTAVGVNGSVGPREGSSVVGTSLLCMVGF